MRVWLAREALGLTQEQVALEAKINQADFSRIEKQSYTPPKAIRERLAVVLKTTPEQLFGELHELAS